MNKKALLEEKSELQSQMELMLNQAESETRALSEDENTQYAELEKKLKEIINELNQIVDSNSENTETMEEDNMENKNVEEKRSFGEGILNGEVRATSTTHANAIPENIANEVIEKMYEVSNVVADAQMVQATGDLEFLVEKEDQLAEVLGETDEITPVDLKDFDKVVLKDKRIGSLVLVSKRLLINSPVVGVDYITNTLSKRMARALEKQIFVANNTEKKLTSGLLQGDVVNLALSGALSIDDIQNLILEMNPVLLNGAKLYMNRETFNKLALLKDNDGKFYLVRDIINDKPAYKILGVVIEISESIEGLQIVLANVSEAIKMKLAENTTIQVLQEKYATSGQIGVLAEFYGDVALVNRQAVKVLK